MRLAGRLCISERLEQRRNDQLDARMSLQARIELAPKLWQIGGSGDDQLAVNEPVRLGRGVRVLPHVLAARTAGTQVLDLSAVHEQQRALAEVLAEALDFALCLLERDEAQPSLITCAQPT